MEELLLILFVIMCLAFCFYFVVIVTLEAFPDITLRATITCKKTRRLL